MAAITASMVAELRGKTDAPMMECKKALTEAAGDMAKAEELLRVKLGTKAGKAASRVTAEGVVASFVEGNLGALVEVNSETDFVSKNDSFIAMAKAAAELIAMLQALPPDLPVMLRAEGGIDHARSVRVVDAARHKREWASTPIGQYRELPDDETTGEPFRVILIDLEPGPT